MVLMPILVWIQDEWISQNTGLEDVDDDIPIICLFPMPGGGKGLIIIPKKMELAPLKCFDCFLLVLLKIKSHYNPEKPGNAMQKLSA